MPKAFRWEDEPIVAAKSAPDTTHNATKGIKTQSIPQETFYRIPMDDTSSDAQCKGKKPSFRFIGS
jgi:hypothetical protein